MIANWIWCLAEWSRQSSSLEKDNHELFSCKQDDFPPWLDEKNDPKRDQTISNRKRRRGKRVETIIFVQWLTIAMRYCNSLENAFFLLSPSPFIFHPSYLIKSNIIVMGKSTVRLSRDKTSVCIYLVQKRNEEKKNRGQIKKRNLSMMIERR